jgi:hypothetical protein
MILMWLDPINKNQCRDSRFIPSMGTVDEAAMWSNKDVHISRIVQQAFL